MEVAGPEHGKSYQLSPANEIPLPSASLVPSCSPAQQLPDLQQQFQTITEKLWGLAVLGRAQGPQTSVPDDKVSGFQWHLMIRHAMQVQAFARGEDR